MKELALGYQRQTEAIKQFGPVEIRLQFSQKETGVSTKIANFLLFLCRNNVSPKHEVTY